MYILPHSLCWNGDETQNHDHKKAQRLEDLSQSVHLRVYMNSYFFLHKRRPEGLSEYLKKTTAFLYFCTQFPLSNELRF